MQLKSKAEWYAQSNRVMLGAKGFFFDSAGSLLLVKTTYKGWALPGGVVDQSETPQEAVKRECLEELNLGVHEAKLLTCFSQTKLDPTQDFLYFYFSCGELTVEDAKLIKVDKKEIAEWKFWPIIQLREAGLPNDVLTMITRSLEAYKTGTRFLSTKFRVYKTPHQVRGDDCFLFPNKPNEPHILDERQQKSSNANREMPDLRPA